jgi:segregation and condensation protein A
MAYKVELDIYCGPLDLLLYLIHEEEIDIYDIPIARITEQYVRYVDILQQLDPEGVSEFLVLAATLMEIKSRTLLPTPPPEVSDDEILDPRLELVRQLLEYKNFKDAAHYLEDSAAQRAHKHARSPVVPPRPSDEVELENLDIWDLFDAFSRLLEQTGRREAVHEVGVDDTPLALHADDIVDSIGRAGGSQRFEEVFAGRTKAGMIGLFLALLELMRQRRVRVSQDRPFGTILLHVIDERPLDDETGPGENLSVTQAVDDLAEAGLAENVGTRDPTDEPAVDVTEAEVQSADVGTPCNGVVTNPDQPELHDETK